MPATLTATPVVQVASGDGPLVANPTWTDVSAKVRAWTTTRQRDEQAGKFQSGSATIVLDNRDRGFEPYTGASLRRKQVRITFSDGTPVFRGIVDRVDLSYGSDGKDSTATLTCTDLLGYLATIQLLAPYTEAVLASQPLVYLPFSETSGTVAADASGNGANAAYDSVSVTLGGASATVDDTGHSVQLSDPYPSPATTGRGAQIRGSIATVPQSISVEFWFKSSAPAEWFYPFGVLGASTLIEFLVATTGAVALFVESPSTQYAIVSGASINVLDGNWHHIVVTAGSLTDPTTFNIYIDGAADGTAGRQTTSGTYQWTPAPGYIIGYGYGANAAGTSGSVVIDQWALYGRALSASEVAAHYAAAAGLLGQLSGARVASIAGYANVPAALLDVDAGSSILTDAGDLGSTKALNILRTIEVTEAGGLFVRRDGVLALRGRAAAQGARSASAVSQRTYTATDYSDLHLADPADQVVTTANVTSRGASGVQSVTDVQAVATSGDITTSLTTDAPGEAKNRAQYEVYRKSHPTALWVSALIFTNRAEPLIHELWDRITVSFAPPGGGAALTEIALITGISHAWDVLNKRLVTTLNLNPIEAQQFGTWDSGLWGRSDTLWDLTAKWGQVSTPWGPNTVDLLDGTARWFL